ncbi:MAG: hypothetical protein R3E45_09470 [Rhodocyclaceae bacterium]
MAFLDLLADRPAIGVFGGREDDADRRAFARGDADHPHAEGNLRPRARARVAAAGHDVEPRAGLVAHQQHLVIEREVTFQAASEGVEQALEAAALAQRIDAAAQRRQQRRTDLGGGQLASR